MASPVVGAHRQGPGTSSMCPFVGRSNCAAAPRCVQGPTRCVTSSGRRGRGRRWTGRRGGGEGVEEEEAGDGQ
eukprot:1838880-Prymnesium_polylepis.1